MTAAPVAKSSDIAPGQMRIVEVAGERIALCNVGGTYYAIQDLCTHDDGPLGAGNLRGDRVECPRHGAQFDVKSGAAVRMPAIAPVRTYPVRVENGSVVVEVE